MINTYFKDQQFKLYIEKVWDNENFFMHSYMEKWDKPLVIVEIKMLIYVLILCIKYTNKKN